MIADDNPYIIEELSNVIDWEDFDMCIAGTFSNGQALLEAAKKNMPDVVLTDISMPVLDGIGLAGALRKISGDVKIIFISSYADFSYAQKALQVQVFEYILKPFDNKQLADTMNRTLKELQAESFQRYEQKRMLKQVETFRKLALEKYMSELLYHSEEDERVSTELAALEVTLFPSFKLLLAMMKPDREDGMFRSNVVNRIRSVLYQNVKQEYQTVFMPVTGGYFALLYICQADFSGLSDLLAQLSIDIEAMTDLHLTIGYSRSCKSFRQLPVLLSQAKEALTQAEIMHMPILGYKAVQPTDGVICPEEDTKLPASDAKSAGSADAAVKRAPSSPASRKYVKEMKAYIEGHFAEPLTTRDVSQAVYLSANYANQLFANECGCTIYEYVTQCRIREAKKLLAKTDKQIVLIAELVGYNGKTNFYLSFKRNVGITPTEYRRQMQEDD